MNCLDTAGNLYQTQYLFNLHQAEHEDAGGGNVFASAYTAFAERTKEEIEHFSNDPWDAGLALKPGPMPNADPIEDVSGVTVSGSQKTSREKDDNVLLADVKPPVLHLEEASAGVYVFDAKRSEWQAVMLRRRTGQP